MISSHPNGKTPRKTPNVKTSFVCLFVEFGSFVRSFRKLAIAGHGIPSTTIAKPDRALGKLRLVSEHEQALAEVLGSVRLEDAEPSPELRDALEQLIADDASADQLDELAKLAAAGAVPKPDASPRAA